MQAGSFHLEESWGGIADQSGLDQTQAGCGAPGLLGEACSGAAWPCFDRPLGCARFLVVLLWLAQAGGVIADLHAGGFGRPAQPGPFALPRDHLPAAAQADFLRAAGQIRQGLEQRFEGRNLVALFGNGNLAQGQPQTMGDGGKQLQRPSVVAPAAAQDLAVHRQTGQHRDLLLQEPGANDQLKLRGIQPADHPEERRVARRHRAAFLIAPTAQSPQLAVGQLAAQVFKTLKTARAHQRRPRRAGQHFGLPVLLVKVPAGAPVSFCQANRVSKNNGLP